MSTKPLEKIFGSDLLPAYNMLSSDVMVAIFIYKSSNSFQKIPDKLIFGSLVLAISPFPKCNMNYAPTEVAE